MGFFYRDDFTLIAYTTTKLDIKKKISRIPKDAPQVKT